MTKRAARLAFLAFRFQSHPSDTGVRSLPDRLSQRSAGFQPAVSGILPDTRCASAPSGVVLPPHTSPLPGRMPARTG